MKDLSLLMESDTQERVENPLGNFDDSNLKGVADLAKQIAVQEQTVASKQEELNKAKKELLRLTDEELPSVLTEMGLSGLKLDDGSEVTIKKIFGASIPNDQKEEAHQWLRNNGFGDMVKNIVSVNFGMGEDEQAHAMTKQLQDAGLDPEQVERVHSSTLRAWVKEQTEKGNEFPMELFGAFIAQRAIIKGAK
tara:strand:- start:2364 stop:2942 length:579 start_codon:yes stop_codon:yes gene_type:complete